MNFNAIFKNVKIIKIGLLEAKLWKKRKKNWKNLKNDGKDFSVSKKTTEKTFPWVKNDGKDFSVSKKTTEKNFPLFLDLFSMENSFPSFF